MKKKQPSPTLPKSGRYITQGNPSPYQEGKANSIPSDRTGLEYFKKKILAWGLLVLCCGSFMAQTVPTDWNLIEKQDFHKAEFDKRKVNFLLIGNNPIIKYNPISLALGGFMFFYQKALSPQFSSKCGYEISCSNFSGMVFRQYGFVKGLALTADRLMRCTPFAAIDINTISLNDKNKVIDNPEKYKLHP